MGRGIPGKKGREQARFCCPHWIVRPPSGWNASPLRGLCDAALIETLIDVTHGRFPAIVVSVQTSNPAARLYARLGFVIEEIAHRVGTASVVMVWEEKEP